MLKEQNLELDSGQTPPVRNVPDLVLRFFGGQAFSCKIGNNIFVGFRRAESHSPSLTHSVQNIWIVLK